MASSNTFQTARKTLIECEADKLPIHLCAKPNKTTMEQAKYESSMREMMENRIFLNNEERKAFGDVVR